MPEAQALLRITGIFEDREHLEKALRALKISGVEDYDAYGPVDLEGLAPLMRRRGSPVRGIATVCAIIGLAGFYYMCVAASLIYKIITGGKPPLSNVPFVIPTYEGTILLGGIGAFVAVLVWAGLFIRGPHAGYDTRFSGDSFGVNVLTEPYMRGEIVRLLQNAGALEVKEGPEE